ncbi:MAG: hypothetical protein O7G88_18695, partial [bacterium]|nr:hypothetical protein [bacterium]
HPSRIDHYPAFHLFNAGSGVGRNRPSMDHGDETGATRSVPTPALVLQGWHRASAQTVPMR